MVTQTEVDIFYKVHQVAQKKLIDMLDERVPESDTGAIADRDRRWQAAQDFARDAKYAWERARDLALQPSS